MQTFLTGVFTLGDVQCGLIAALLFMLPLRKRNGFVWRFPAGAAAVLLLAGLAFLFRGYAMSRFLDWMRSFPTPPLFWGSVAHSLVTCTAQLVLLTAVFCFCCDLPLPQQIYGAVCSLLSENLAYVLFLILFPQDGHRVLNLQMEHTWIELLILAAVYVLIYFLIAARLPKDGEYRFRCSFRSAALFLLLILARTIGVYGRLSNLKPEFYRALLVDSAVVYAVLAVSQLMLRVLHDWREKAALESQLRETLHQERQELLESTDTLRRTGHDLKHILAAIPLDDERHAEFVRELEEALTSYEAHMDTGNDTLDAMLPIAWKRCRENGVRWTCIADGSALQRMAPVDIFVLLGNALDNALESALQEEDPEKRFLSLTIRQQSGMALIRLENACPTEPLFVNGLPVTTKHDPDRHGYGGRSMRDIVARYGGELRMSAQEQVFTLDVALPVKSE